MLIPKAWHLFWAQANKKLQQMVYGTPPPISTQPQFPPPYSPKAPLPHSTMIVVLGILSVLFCWAYGIIGLIFGIIALNLSKKDRKLFEVSPAKYEKSSYKTVNAGRLCAIIGVVISSIMVISFIFYILFGVSIFSLIPYAP